MFKNILEQVIYNMIHTRYIILVYELNKIIIARNYAGVILLNTMLQTHLKNYISKSKDCFN